jgi:hypothetical protein
MIVEFGVLFLAKSLILATKKNKNRLSCGVAFIGVDNILVISKALIVDFFAYLWSFQPT